MSVRAPASSSRLVSTPSTDGSRTTGSHPPSCEHCRCASTSGSSFGACSMSTHSQSRPLCASSSVTCVEHDDAQRPSGTDELRARSAALSLLGPRRASMGRIGGWLAGRRARRRAPCTPHLAATPCRAPVLLVAANNFASAVSVGKKRHKSPHNGRDRRRGGLPPGRVRGAAPPNCGGAGRARRAASAAHHAIAPQTTSVASHTLAPVVRRAAAARRRGDGPLLPAAREPARRARRIAILPEPARRLDGGARDGVEHAEDPPERGGRCRRRRPPRPPTTR